jgi:hypothetical protein
MDPTTPADAYNIGYQDGLENPDDLSIGMTWPDNDLNEAYDRGVNEGQAEGFRRAHAQCIQEGGMSVVKPSGCAWCNTPRAES